MGGKLRTWASMAVVALLFGMGPTRPGCADLLTFEVVTKAETTIEGSDLVLDLFTVAFPDLATFDLSASDEFKNQGVTKEDVESVKITEFTLEVLEPTDGDLSFFDSVSFFVEADGLERVRVAHYDTFEEGQAKVSLVLDDVELRDYAAAESMDITTEVSARSPSDDTTLQARIVLDVQATTQGACRAVTESL